MQKHPVDANEGEYELIINTDEMSLPMILNGVH